MSRNRPGRAPSGTNPGAIRVYHRCGGCGKKQEFANSGKFRVNANGSSVDVWLIYRCKKMQAFLEPHDL